MDNKNIPRKRKRVFLCITLGEQLDERLAQFMAAQEVKPTRSEVIRKSIDAYLRSQGI